MKKIKLFALAALALLSTNAFAQADLGQTFAGANGVEYTVITAYTPADPENGLDAVPGEVEVVGYTQSLTTVEVTIPSVISNNNTAIAAQVPTTNTYNVVSIDANSFEGCKSTKITLPATINAIDDEAFKDCEATQIVIPVGSRLQTIGDNAFEGCAKLATLATANATLLNTIGDEAFMGCTALTTFTAGQYLKSIGTGAFKGTGLTSLDLSSCKNFTTANGAVVDAWFTVNADPYKTNNKLATVILPTALATPATDVLAIANNAFEGCTALKTIGTTANTFAIPAYVDAIGAGAFLNTGITVFDLSANAKIKAFDAWFTTTVPNTSTATLTQVILNKDFNDPTNAAKTYTIGNNLKAVSTLAKIGSNDTNGEYQLPKGVTLAADMFEGTGLTKLDLSKYDTDDMALPALFGAGIATLTEVVLNVKTTELADEAFANCTALATLNNIAKLKIVGDGAFYRTAIAEFAFGAPLTLAGFNTPFTPGTPLTDDDGNDLPYSTATSISIDLSASANITTIADDAFASLAQLTSIKLPSTLEEIGDNAFDGTGIAAITIPATVLAAKIGDQAFANCKSLKSLDYIPNAGPTGSIFTTDPFKGCTLVTINTTQAYIDAAGAAPTNSKYNTASAESVTTVKDKVKNQAMKGFISDKDYRFSTEKCVVYEAYINGEDIVMSPLRKRGAYYNVPANTAVIIRTENAETVEATPFTISTTVDADKTSMLYGAVGDNCLRSVLVETARESVTGFGNYMYVLVNNATYGFSFQYYTGAKIKKGNIYVINPNKAPGARMNIVWLDENGNVEEEEATAIKAVEAAEAEDGAIYNLQGVRVSAAKKGLYIKNGKKFIIK